MIEQIQGEGALPMEDQTIKFHVTEDTNREMKRILTSVYCSLSEKGYNPINQIVGYLLSEDPTYITNHNGARTEITKIDRDELMQELVRHYLFS
jgi:uncharacterized protein (UPF0297 family)